MYAQNMLCWGVMVIAVHVVVLCWRVLQLHAAVLLPRLRRGERAATCDGKDRGVAPKMPRTGTEGVGT